MFFFKEGFCWTDINSTYLKARLKVKGIFDVVSMSLFTKTSLPDWYYVVVINTKFISEYVDSYINSTSHFQINDARKLPIVIPTKTQLKEIEPLFLELYKMKKDAYLNGYVDDTRVKEIEDVLEIKVKELYGI